MFEVDALACRKRFCGVCVLKALSITGARAAWPVSVPLVPCREGKRRRGSGRLVGSGVALILSTFRQALPFLSTATTLIYAG